MSKFFQTLLVGVYVVLTSLQLVPIQALKLALWAIAGVSPLLSVVGCLLVGMDGLLFFIGLFSSASIFHMPTVMSEGQ